MVSKSAARRSLVGDDDTMRHIYIDEAGQDSPSPVTVVAGIIVRPDDHWRAVERRMNAFRKAHIPDDAWKAWGGFFHAKDLFNGGKLGRREWPPQRRYAVLKDLLSILHKEYVPMAIGYVRRRPKKFPDLIEEQTAKWDYLIAFAQCLNAADKYLRRQEPPETATVVAEHAGKMNKALRVMLEGAKSAEIPEEIRKIIEVTQIIDTAHFAEKDGAMFLQLADACAYTIGRYFKNKGDVGDLVKVITGSRAPFDRNAGSGQSLIVPIPFSGLRPQLLDRL